MILFALIISVFAIPSRSFALTISEAQYTVWPCGAGYCVNDTSIGAISNFTSAGVAIQTAIYHLNGTTIYFAPGDYPINSTLYLISNTSLDGGNLTAHIVATDGFVGPMLDAIGNDVRINGFTFEDSYAQAPPILFPTQNDLLVLAVIFVLTGCLTTVVFWWIRKDTNASQEYINIDGASSVTISGNTFQNIDDRGIQIGSSSAEESDTAAPEARVTCAYCGSDYPADALKCPICGASKTKRNGDS